MSQWQPPRPAYVPGMEHFYPQPKRPSWARRHYKLWWVLGALAVAGVVAVIGNASSHPDYRDPAQLARAVKAQEHSTTASCGKLPTGKYFCSAAYGDGTSANYTITVSPDGHSWSAS